MSSLWNIKRRLLLGGPILIVLGLVIYLVRGVEFALVLPIIGVVLVVGGILYKPKKKKENPATNMP
ncbi:MAG TPA: hypothetical protein VMD05_06435 [Candidatus Nanoarchaeia archaeon]|nr:hypothetical protein [Candidatus Nanoarchaeia archaeon]